MPTASRLTTSRKPSSSGGAAFLRVEPPRPFPLGADLFAGFFGALFPVATGEV